MLKVHLQRWIKTGDKEKLMVNIILGRESEIINGGSLSQESKHNFKISYIKDVL